MSYYDIKEIGGKQVLSASLLKSVLSGQPFDQPDNENFRFGRVFHQLVLEPSERTEPISAEKLELAKYMRAAVWRQYGYDFFFMDARREWEIFRTVNGMPHKCKIDIWRKSEKMVVDLKTTSAWSEEGVRESIVKWGYDLQAYFYLMMTRAEVFRLIFVSKSYPHKIYEVDIVRGDMTYQLGQLAYLEAIHKIKNVPRGT